MSSCGARWRNHQRNRETSYARLLYNYFRTYDPSTGRYLESDPIGLEGGLNTYGYALQNPLTYIDPTGEDSVRAKIIEAIAKGDYETAKFLIQEAAALSRQEAKQLATQCASARRKTLLDELKDAGVGAGARSGQHGVPYSRAGAQMIREANLIPKGPIQDAMKTAGKQLIEKGKGINH
jgi:RHS repeat-associated protein